MNSRDKLILATAGAAVGVIVGLLLAPEKGTDLRKKISKQSKNIADSLHDTYENVSKKVRREAEDIGDDAKQTARKAQHTTSDFLS